MRKLTLCLIGLFAVSALGCVDHEGQLAILMTSTTSTTVSASQVNLEITSVELWDAGSNTWVTVSGGSQVHELVGLNGRLTPIALVDAIDEGTYSRVRITFNEARSGVVLSSGRREPLRVEPTAITVQTIAPVVEDQAFNLTLELDLDASLAERPSGSWLIRPVVRQVGG
ncbi:MAG: DUF4382 domain-containing protein [Acidobacteria bacterium]|nr:DUF4382 domain-containing protein [Acidobacteriota bacterium]